MDFAPIHEAMAEALAKVAEDQREAMRLRVIEGLPYAEVASRLSCTEQNARQRVSRGLRKLALVLQASGVHPATEVEA